jgi:FkbM family methyltransferase
MLADLPDTHQQRDIATALMFVRGFGLAVDCGAHRGIVTTHLLKRFSSVVAIEPGPLWDKIPQAATVLNKALGANPGLCSMRDGVENTGQRHVVPGTDVEVITLDSLGLEPDFIKIDVEGLEYDVLRGGEQTVRENRPVVMIEENGLNRRYGIPDFAAVALLESWGMKLCAKVNKDYIYGY